MNQSRKQERNNKKIRLNRRRQAQFHRGGKEEERRPGRERYVHSKRKGNLIRDRGKTVEQLVVARNRVDKRRKAQKTVMVVGTTPELGRLMERVLGGENGKGRIRVSRSWISGMLTNYGKFRTDVLRRKGTKPERRTRSEKRWYDRKRKGREKYVDQNERPGMIRFRHPNDHGVGRKEAARCGIPTAGIVDTDCKYSERLRYPIPGNDESRRGQRRRRRRRKKRRS